MSRFNSAAVDRTKTVNHQGAVAYKLSDELDLYSLVCTASLKDKFYENNADTFGRIRTLVPKCDPMFVAQLAVYAREQMYLRSIPVVLTVELAKVHSGDSLVSTLATRVIQRADEITEMLSYYQMANDRKGMKKLGKLSKQLEKGIANAFNKFDEYQFAKYNRDTEIKLRDALFLTHPKPKDGAQALLFEKICNDTLEVPYTWETQLSEAGKTGKDKKVVWEELIESRKVGYMAILRNLRNILEAGVSPRHITMVCDYISNENAVLGSKQLPFRFLAAYRMLTTGNDVNQYTLASYNGNKFTVSSPYTGAVLESLEKAVVISTRNIPMFENETVLLATDVSGSMVRSVSERSVITRYDIGSMLCMLVHNKAKFTTTGMFGDSWKEVNFPKTGVLRNANEIYKREGEVGYATNGYKVLEWANKHPHKYDRVMMFTDGQMYNSGRFTRDTSDMEQEWLKYKKTNPNAKLYLFDLAGYGTTPVSLRNNDVYLISGWSDKVFDVLNAIDEGQSALDKIKSIEL